MHDTTAKVVARHAPTPGMESDDGNEGMPTNPQKKIRMTKSSESEQLPAKINPSTPIADDTQATTLTAETEHNETPQKKNLSLSHNDAMPKHKLRNVTKMILPGVAGNVNVLDKQFVDAWIKQNEPDEEFTTERDKIHRVLDKLLTKTKALKMFTTHLHGKKPASKKDAINAIADFVAELYG
jgi:hypothetical protein